jgi:hypothetical protein
VTLLTKQDLADIREIAGAGGLGLNPHTTLKLLNAYEQLVATLDDVARGSTHELVRYWIEKTIAAEKRVEKAQAAAQAWRHHSLASERMTGIKSATMERCAAEIDEALR